MPTFDEIESSISNMKTWCNSTLPNFPNPKIKVSDIRSVFDVIFDELSAINGKAEEAMIATEADIVNLQNRPIAVNADWNANSGLAQIQNKPSSFPPSAHTHVANDISNASTIGKSVLTAADGAAIRSLIGAGASSFSGSYSDLTNKPTRASFGFVAPATAIANSATNAPTDCPTNAPTDAKTDYNVVTTLLGTLVDGLNTTNTKQNQQGANINSIASKVNTGFGILNVLAARFNLSLDIHRNNGMLSV